MSQVTTHILDTARGSPASGVAVSLSLQVADAWQLLATGTTNDDGRVADLLPQGSRGRAFEHAFATEGVRAKLLAAFDVTDEVRALDEGADPQSIRPAKGVHVTRPSELLEGILAAETAKRDLFEATETRIVVPLAHGAQTLRDDSMYLERGAWRIGYPHAEPYLVGEWSASQMGAGQAFPGTIWIAAFGSNEIYVMEPNDFGGGVLVLLHGGEVSAASGGVGRGAADRQRPLPPGRQARRGRHGGDLSREDLRGRWLRSSSPNRVLREDACKCPPVPA